MSERWRPVAGWPYEVSDRGRVRRAAPASGTRPGLILKPDKGTHQVRLRDRGRAVRKLVSHLVLEAFDRPRPPGMECLHGPAGQGDNRWPEAIRWGTPAENNGPDKVRDGTDNGGERNPQAKLTATQVADIRRRWAAGQETQLAIAADYGADNTQVSRIVNGHTWLRPNQKAAGNDDTTMSNNSPAEGTP